MRTIVLGAALCLAAARVGNAETISDPDTVQFLHEVCMQEGKPESSHFCLGYLKGAAQVMTVNGYQHHSPFEMCPPNDQAPSGAALIQSFMNWADKNPEHWHDHMLPALAHAFQETWPCQKSN